MLAIIPARGGSKGLPRKNILPLAGRPLIGWAIEAALNATGIERVIVSTEDEEIAQVACACGADVPFMRPAALAGDAVPSGLACLGVVDMLRERGEGEVTRFALVQATNPLVRASDIGKAVALSHEPGVGAVVSLTPFETPIESVFEVDSSGHLLQVLKHRYGVEAQVGMRQSFGKRYVVCGAVTIVDVAAMRSNPNYYYADPSARAIVIEAPRGLDIDTALDLQTAEQIMAAAASNRRGEHV